MGAIDFTPTQNHEMRKTFEDHGIDYDEEVHSDVAATPREKLSTGRVAIENVSAFIHYETSSEEIDLIKYHEDMQSSNIKYLLMYGDAQTKRFEDFEKAISWLDRVLP